MIVSRAASSAWLLPLALLSVVDLVDGHGYMQSPRSRNFVAHEDGVWWPIDPNLPQPESEPQSANIGGTDAVCGIIADARNYDYPKNAEGGPMPPNAQACWTPGQEVDLSVVITAHHKGHFEFKACPIQPGEVATQACFDQHPLEFVQDTTHGAPKDVNYPVRAYIPPATEGWNYNYKYVLPAGLSGDLVLIQWYYATANSCHVEGYEDYPFPAGWDPQIQACPAGGVPPDGRGVPEQFWNCAEVTISPSCGGGGPVPPPSPVPPPGPVTPPPSTSVTPPPSTPNPPSPPPPRNAPPPPTNCPSNSGQCGPGVTCESIGFPGHCCSQWGWCGTSPDHCGECCQNGPCANGPAPPPPTPGPPSPTPPTPPGPDNYTADHGEDSRLIAYVGNWQTCPTVQQTENYSHMVIAFAVSYTWSPSKNQCSQTCDVSAPPTCENVVRQDLIDGWRAAGKKVILSFGGAGMGGSWSGDQNNCWDYCFGKEEQVTDQLVNIIDSQNLDGIDIDYEYCYDIAGSQSGKCNQRSSSYSDSAAQNFLHTMTNLMRVKLDALQSTNGYSRGRYEVTHAPMDSDLTPSTNAYFQILRNRRADLDFIMPQFYNGVTRPALGVDYSVSGQPSAAAMFSSLSNEMFDSEPNKVVFGHCISDCSGTGSNINAAQAVQVTSDVKTINSGEFACNGGAFFWVALHDTGGAWSDAVVAEVATTAGCSNSNEPPPSTTSTTAATTTAATTTAATTTAATTTAATTTAATTTAATTTAATTTAATTTAATTTAATTTAATTTAATTTAATTTAATTTAATTTAATTTAATTTTSGNSNLVISTNPRCGLSEVDARENCKDTCVSGADCPAGEHCWGVHANYCGSFPQRTFIDPVVSSTNHRCGKGDTDVEARAHAMTFCGEPCPFGTCDDPEYTCKALYLNYCGSEYTDDGPDTTTTTTVPDTTTTAATTTAATTSATTTTTGSGELIISTEPRCGTSEVAAREQCGNTCANNNDCAAGEWCWGVHSNYCGSFPQRVYTNPQLGMWTRCGQGDTYEEKRIWAQTFCGEPCTWQCSEPGQTCMTLNHNWCGSDYEV